MNRKVLAGMLAGIAMLMLSTTAAQAGSGGKPSALTSFFVCKTINGDPPAAGTVDVQSFDAIQQGAGWGFSLNAVKLGNAILACAFARLFPGNSPVHDLCPPVFPATSCNEIDPNPNKSLSMKCYAVTVPKNEFQVGGAPVNYSVTDSLFLFPVTTVGVDPNVTGSGVQLICGPASFNPQ